MNSGKSTALLQAAFNYEERGQEVLLAKPLADTKGNTKILSRLGVARETDFQVRPEHAIRRLFHETRGDRVIACLLIDEAQFLTRDHVDDLLRIAVQDDIPVLTYGIRTDFQTCAFPGSARLLELAHTLEELKTICRCGRKAMFNGRKVDGSYIFEGDQVAIDGDDVEYESLCGVCYLTESGGNLGEGV